MKKKIKYFLQMYDGIWSVPFAFFGYWFLGIALMYFDVSAGTYDLAFVQPFALACAIVIGASNVSVLGLYFGFRGFFRFLYGSNSDNILINKSKEEWENLKTWQKFVFSLGVFFCYFWAVVIVYLKMI